MKTTILANTKMKENSDDESIDDSSIKITKQSGSKNKIRVKTSKT